MLGDTGTEQFVIETLVNGELIREQRIHDPFLHSTTFLRGFKHAWRALFGGIKVTVRVSGTEGVIRAVMTLDPEKLQAETDTILEGRRRGRESQASDCNFVATMSR